MPYRTLLFSLRVLLILATYCFVVQPFSLFSFLQWFPSNEFFYVVITLLGITTLWVTWRQHPTVYPTYKSLLISFFPVALIIGIGPWFAREFHYLVHLSVGLYVIASFSFWGISFIRLQQAKNQINDVTKIFTPFAWRERNNRIASCLVLVLTLLFFTFGLQNLTRFAAVDEPLWLDGRIGNFWKNLSLERMDKTLVSDKPGITIAIASGPGLWFVHPKDYREARNAFEMKHPSANIEDLYRAFRLPLLIVITLLLPLFYLLLVPLVGTTAALFGYSAITLSPILIGMSKIVNPDSLLWVFAPLSFLAYLVFLEKKSWRFLILSGVFFGLALLTKYVANFLVVYLFTLSFLYPLWKQGEHLTLSFLFKVFLVWFGIGIATLYLFVPAFWVAPSTILASTIFSQAFEKVAWIFITLMTLVFIDQFLVKSRVSIFFIDTLKPYGGMFGKIILGFFVLAFGFAFLNSLFGMPWIHFSEMLASPKTSGLDHTIRLFFTNFYPLAFGVAPLILLGMSAALWRTWQTHFRSFTALHRLILAVIVFIPLYYFGSTVNGVVLINRYQIMLYPLLALVGGIGLFILIEVLWKYLRKSPPPTGASFVFLAGIGFFLAISPLFTHFPLSYTSSLLPKPYSVDVKDMGAGSYEAAMYLNSLPDAKNTTIWTDKSGVCKFYVGPCIDGFTKRHLQEYKVRYIVLSSGRQSRTENRFTSEDHTFNPNDLAITRLNTYYGREDALHTIKINNRPSQYVKIFTLNQ